MGPLAPTRRELLAATGGVLVVGFSLAGCAGLSRGGSTASAADPESLDSWIAIARDGSVTVFTGRVDLGTGTEIALAQFAAE
jgi:CO/xanthine dehydrogenase Mo-binding subunit